MESPEETGQGDRVTQGEVTGQGRPHLPKLVLSAEGGKGKDKRERLIVGVRSLCQEHDTADHTPARTSQCWSRQTPHGLGVCIWMHLVNGMGNSPSLGQPTPGVVKTGQIIQGLR